MKIVHDHCVRFIMGLTNFEDKIPVGVYPSSREFAGTLTVVILLYFIAPSSLQHRTAYTKLMNDTI
jgi:hypothetical protein